jgi:hypothetical protein
VSDETNVFADFALFEIYESVKGETSTGFDEFSDYDEFNTFDASDLLEFDE